MKIGILKTNIIKYCEICGCKYTKKIEVVIYEGDDVEQKKKDIQEKANKKYTCKICKSIKEKTC